MPPNRHKCTCTQTQTTLGVLEPVLRTSSFSCKQTNKQGLTCLKKTLTVRVTGLKFCVRDIMVSFFCSFSEKLSSSVDLGDVSLQGEHNKASFLHLTCTCSFHFCQTFGFSSSLQDMTKVGRGCLTHCMCKDILCTLLAIRDKVLGFI